MNNFPGLWICIDGPDFTGKGIQTANLVRKLINKNEDNVVTCTHEPTRYALQIKAKLKAERGDAYSNASVMADLYIDDRLRNEKKVIKPILEAGGIVVSNRHKYSTIAYQQAQGMKLSDLVTRHKTRLIGTPDVTCLLFCDDETELSRRMKNTGKIGDKFESDFEFQKKVAINYHELVQLSKSDIDFYGDVYAINPPKKSRRIEDISAFIWDTVKPYYMAWEQTRDRLDTPNLDVPLTE